MKTFRLMLQGGFIIVLLAIALIMSGCQSDDDDDDSSILLYTLLYTTNNLDLAYAAAKALPAIPSLSASSSWAGDRVAAVGSAPTDSVINSFFKLECYMPDVVDNCPAGVTKDIDTNKYTVTTLIGVIYHAELYMENTLAYYADDCSNTTVDASSFVTNDSGGDTSAYLIDYFSLLDCVGSSSYSDQTQYYAYRSDTTSDVTRKDVMIVTRKHDTATSGWDQSDIFQAYLSKDSSAANHILAFNTVNINRTSSDASVFRTVLLVNLATRKFLVKFHGSGSNYIVAAGQGGVSAAGVYESGYYFAKSNESASGVCIDNSTRLEADASNCSNEDATWSGASDVVSYLDMTTTEQTDLANFISYFAAGPTQTALASGQYPTSAADVANIPDRIE